MSQDQGPTVFLSQQLGDLLGGDARLPLERLSDYAIDGLIPEVVVQPSNRGGIAEVLRWASENRVGVFPRGGGTQLALGNVPSRVDLVLDLSRCDRVLEHQPADLTATVEAGVTLDLLERELARHGQFLPLESPLPSRATIGGILAANASGSMRSSYGLARDWLIGVHVISASGVETKAGGKVVKNVTGYDLNKLYAGSLGTLGVIVEATFKLSPLPRDSRTLVAVFASCADGLEAGRRLLGQSYAPQAMHVIDGGLARRLDIAPAPPAGGAAAVAFFAGRPRAVQRRIDEGIRWLRDSGAIQVERRDSVWRQSPVASPPNPLSISDGEGAEGEAAGVSLVQRLTDLGWTGASRPCLGLRASVPPAAVGQMVCLSQEALVFGQRPGVIADVGFGVVRLLWWAEGESGQDPLPQRDIRSPAPGQRAEEKRVLEVIAQLRSVARRSGGSLVVEHCPLPAKSQIDVWGDEPDGVEIMRRIKQRFDPLGILNPGRFAGRI